MTFSNLSDELKSLLVDVKISQMQKESHYDPRGYYAEYDSNNSKPYDSDTIVEAQDISWLIIHKDSDRAFPISEPESETFEDDEGEEYEEMVEDFCSGVSFISIKKEFLDSVYE